MNPMNSSLTLPRTDLSQFTRSELASLVPDLHKEALKRHVEWHVARLAGPITPWTTTHQNGLEAQIYRGPVQLVHGWPKMPLNP